MSGQTRSGQTIDIWVPGQPVPKARARHGRTKQGKPVTYSDPKTKAYESYVALCASSKAPREPMGGPIALSVTVYLKRPQRPDKRYQGYPAGRPDLDNYVKAAMDGLSLAGIWADDARVVQLTAAKQWAPTDGAPGLSIQVRPV